MLLALIPISIFYAILFGIAYLGLTTKFDD